MLQASAFVCLALASLPAAAQTKPKLVTEEFMVPAKTLASNSTSATSGPRT